MENPYNHRRILTILFCAIITFACLVIILAANHNHTLERITGQARAISGDTLSIDGKIIRLKEISACKLGQLAITDGREIDCGLWAKKKLEKLIQNQNVMCKIWYRNSDNKMTGKCYAPSDTKRTLSWEMQRMGGAFRRNWLHIKNGKDPRHILLAKKHKLGIWGFEHIEHPELWARQQRKQEKQNH